MKQMVRIACGRLTIWTRTRRSPAGGTGPRPLSRVQNLHLGHDQGGRCVRTIWTRTRQIPAGGTGPRPRPAGSAPGGRCCAPGPAQIMFGVVWNTGGFGRRVSVKEPKQQRHAWQRRDPRTLSIVRRLPCTGLQLRVGRQRCTPNQADLPAGVCMPNIAAATDCGQKRAWPS
jgi:hypothetical protein